MHPYMPSSDPKREQPLLDTVGVSDASELYNVIPENLRLHRSLDLPKPLLSEQALERHIEDLFSKNTSCKKNLNFLGAGCCSAAGAAGFPASAAGFSAFFSAGLGSVLLGLTLKTSSMLET